MKDKYYYFGGEGHALGSEIVIKAKRKSDAIRLAKKEARNIGVPDPDFDDVSEVDANDGPISAPVEAAGELERKSAPPALSHATPR